MKKTVSIGLGGRNLIIDEDAYVLLDKYLDSYSATLIANKKEVMEEVEARFADLLKEALGHVEVINAQMVDSVASEMGLPKPSAKNGKDSAADSSTDGDTISNSTTPGSHSKTNSDSSTDTTDGATGSDSQSAGEGAAYAAGFSSEKGYNTKQPQQTSIHKFYRDTDDRKIGGVCSGLALYFDVDVVLIRVLFLAALIFATAGFWIYIIVCIAAPSAYTAAEKCQMRGIPCTAENIRRFVDTRK